MVSCFHHIRAVTPYNLVSSLYWLARIFFHLVWDLCLKNNASVIPYSFFDVTNRDIQMSYMSSSLYLSVLLTIIFQNKNWAHLGRQDGLLDHPPLPKGRNISCKWGNFNSPGRALFSLWNCPACWGNNESF